MPPLFSPTFAGNGGRTTKSKKGVNEWAPVFAAFAVLALLVWGYLTWLSTERITIRNQSGRTVKSLQVGAFQLGELETGKERTKWILVDSGKVTIDFKADYGVDVTTGIAVGYTTKYRAPGNSDHVLR